MSLHCSFGLLTESRFTPAVKSSVSTPAVDLWLHGDQRTWPVLKC